MRTQLSAFAAVVAALLAMAAPAQAAPPSRTGQVVLFAGRGEAGFSGDGGPAREARISAERISAGRDGAVYLSDADRVRRVTPDGVIDTVYVARRDVGYGDGATLTAAAPGPDGSLYVTSEDDGGERQLFRVGRTGAVTVLAGQSKLGAASREGDGIDDVAVDGAGNAFLYDATNRRVVRVAASGRVTRFGSGAIDLTGVQLAAGPNGVVYVTGEIGDRNGGAMYAVGATGPSRTVVVTPGSEERPPSGPAVAADGTVYFVDQGRRQVMRLDKDGSAVPVSEQFDVVGDDLAVGPDGDLYVTYGRLGSGTSQVLRLAQHDDGDAAAPGKPGRSAWADDAPGTVHTVAGTGRRPPAAREQPQRAPEGDEPVAGGIAVDRKGTVYVAEPTRNQVRAIAPDGTTRRFAGTGAAGETTADYDGDKADAVVLNQPAGIATAPDGTVYLTANKRLYRVDTAGKISKIDVGGPDILDVPTLVATDPAGRLYYADYDTIQKVGADGRPEVVVGATPGTADERPARSLLLHNPRWLEAGADGSVYFVQEDSDTIRVARPNGTVDTVAGEGTAGFAGDGGPATRALTNHSRAAAVGRDGFRYIADTYNNRVRRIDARGTITTIAGTGRYADTGDGGPATRAALAEPTGVDVGPDGTVFVLTSSDQVRAVDANGTIRTLADLDPEPSRRAADTTFARLDSFAVGMDGTVYLAAASGLYSTEPDGMLRPVGLDPPLPTFGKYGPTMPPESDALAMGPDGSLYVVPDALLRVHPDGAVVPLLGGGKENRVSYQPVENWSSPMEYTFREGDPQGIEIGSDGTVYLSTSDGVYSLSPDGKLDTLLKAGKYEYFGGIGLDPDGRLYLINDFDNVDRVVDGGTEPVVSPATDKKPKFDANLDDTADIAFTSDGTMFVSAGRHIHRFSPDGDAAIVYESDKSGVTQLAAGPGDDLYFLEEDTRQVRVLVKATQAPEQSDPPISMVTTVVVCGTLVVLGGAFLVVWRVRKRPLKVAESKATA